MKSKINLSKLELNKCNSCGEKISFDNPPHVCLKKIVECVKYLKSKGFTPEDYRKALENEDKL